MGMEVQFFEQQDKTTISVDASIFICYWKFI
jgi:hypothetical protein